MNVLNLLVSLGLPSAIIAMAAMAYLFKEKYENISKASLIIAISLAALLGVYQLVGLIFGRDVSIKTNPGNFSALTINDRVQPAVISVYKGSKVIKKDTFLASDSAQVAARPLKLSYFDSSRFSVLAGQYAQGLLSFQILRDNGWRPATTFGDRSGETPRYWFTHKVFVGNEIELGDTGDSGVLSLKFLAIKDNRAQVRLSLQGQSKPTPRSVGILNKGLEPQDFEGLPTFYIAVREANFSKNWAAFSVFQYRGY